MIIFITYSVSSCGPSTQDALNYFDKIIALQETVVQAEENLQDAVFSLIEEDSLDLKPEKIENETELLLKLDAAYASLLKSIEESLEKLHNTEAFNNSTMLRDEAIKMVTVFFEVASSEYAEIIILLKKPDSEFKASDNKRFNELWVRTINIKLNKAVDDFTVAQLEYAKSWNFDIDDSLTMNE